jgi:hypothetical protein
MPVDYDQEREKIKNFLTEYYTDADNVMGKVFKYGDQLVMIYIDIWCSHVLQ